MKDEIVNVSLSSVAQALATDYFCIYYINTENNKFIEYSASPEYKAFGLPTAGDDIISFSRNQFEEILFPEDREMFLETFTKENVIAALNERNTFTMTFRMMFRDGPTYVHLKVTRMIEKDGRHAVIGISSVDEVMRARGGLREGASSQRHLLPDRPGAGGRLLQHPCGGSGHGRVHRVQLPE